MTTARWLATEVFCLAVSVVVLGAGSSSAQPVVATPVAAGDCAVIVQFAAPPAPGTDVELKLNAPTVFAHVPANGRSSLAIRLNGPLAVGDVLAARSVAGGTAGPWGASVTVGAGDGTAQCDAPPPASSSLHDAREALEVTAYLGRAYDNFAPGQVGAYRAGEASDATWRFIAGVDFDFRVFGEPDDDVQLWLAGETLHGVRSADVDCSVEPKPALCTTNRGGETDRFLETLRGASSLEAYLTPRLELFTFQGKSDFTTKFYVTSRFGVMMLKDAPEAFSVHHLGAGLITSVGPFVGSYLEVGWGRTDLFLENPGERHGRWNRLKLDGLVSFPLFGVFLDRAKDWKRAPRMFVQIYSDFDVHDRAADSIQTFVGLDFDLSAMLR